MNHDHSQHHQDPEPNSFWDSRYAIGLIVLGSLAAYLLLSEHRAHFLGALPLLLLLACPLMHIFMHGGHGGHDHDGQQRTDAPNASQPPKTGEQP